MDLREAGRPTIDLLQSVGVLSGLLVALVVVGHFEDVHQPVEDTVDHLERRRFVAVDCTYPTVVAASNVYKKIHTSEKPSTTAFSRGMV